MRVLDHKLFRELWDLKIQVLAISLVLASGLATYVMSAAVLTSLQSTQRSIYSDFRFPDVFASLKRAPESVATRLAAIPGVRELETRVAAPATIDLAGYAFPINGQIVSLPRGGPRLNRLYLRAGRLPEPDRDQEVAISDGFAEAQKMKPGTTLLVTINGRQRRVDVVGIASTPEFIYQLAPGSIVPDFANYAILWMNRKPLEAAFNMTGAFNQVAGTLDAGASLKNVIEEIDSILEPYGGLDAYGRKDQPSHRYLTEEFRQLNTMAVMFPTIFLSVAAFLLNVVLGRLMATQRAQIAILKAFGYTTGAIVRHFLKLAVLIAMAGLVIGVGAGMWLGNGLTGIYMQFYRFPYLEFSLDRRVILLSSLYCAGCALGGTIFAVLRSAGESPAVAMTPEAPGRYRPSIFERLGLDRVFSQPTRMILRNIERKPLKSLFSVLGVAMSAGILILGGFWSDAVDYMVYSQLRRAQIDDLSVTFTGPVAGRALASLTSLPGVSYAEPSRSVPARIRFEHRTYRTALQGIEAEGKLRRLLDPKMRRVELPESGIIMTDYLAGILGAKTGDMLTVELLEGNRAVRQLPLAGVVSEYVGVNAYMRLDSLNRFMREGSTVTGAYLSVDPAREAEVYARLQKMPAVASTAARRRVLQSFYDVMADQTLMFAYINTMLATFIAIGVIYNTARITLSERSRELASLRVLGYTRGEVSYILLGELALLVFVGIPVGLGIGYGLAGILATVSRSELFRVPFVVGTWTYAFASLVVLSSAGISALVVRHRIDHFDLVAVLKARE
jgi:putative ABC transport system permease protein